MKKRVEMLSNVLTIIAAVTALATPASHAVTGAPAHTKQRAERNLLAVAPRSWPRQAARAGLIDPSSKLLRNNVQAVCRGRGGRIGTRYRRFTCVVRMRRPKSHASLRLTYRALRSDRFRAHLVSMRR